MPPRVLKILACSLALLPGHLIHLRHVPWHARRVHGQWQQFLATDIDQNGEVSAFELQRMLAVGGLVFSLQTVVQIVNLHSPRDKGALNFDEFRAVKQFLSNIQASFQYLTRARRVS